MLSSTTARVASRVLSTRTTLPTATALLHNTKRSYHDAVIQHYEAPRNVGSLDKNDESVGTVRW